MEYSDECCTYYPIIFLPLLRSFPTDVTFPKIAARPFSTAARRRLPAIAPWFAPGTALNFVVARTVSTCTTILAPTFQRPSPCLEAAVGRQFPPSFPASRLGGRTTPAGCEFLFFNMQEARLDKTGNFQGQCKWTRLPN